MSPEGRLRVVFVGNATLPAISHCHIKRVRKKRGITGEREEGKKRRGGGRKRYGGMEKKFEYSSMAMDIALRRSDIYV